MPVVIFMVICQLFIHSLVANLPFCCEIHLSATRLMLYSATERCDSRVRVVNVY